MTDNARYGNPADFDVDLHSIYAAYLGDFDSQNIDWWDASWGGYFRSFNDFLGFGWEGMVVVDAMTGRAHIAARREQITLFARMIKTRFGETLDKEPPSLLPLDPVPSRSRSLNRVAHITDLQHYRKLSTTLAPAELNHLRVRVRAGEPSVIGALFHAGSPDPDGYAASAGVRTNGQGYTWACLRTTWWEKGGPPQGFVPGHGRTVMAKPGQGGKALILEVGLAALRCANLRAVDVWPPIPDKNYRKAHYVIEEWVDKRTNVERPNYPRAYGFGRSQFTAEKSVERVIDASLGALASHDVENNANTLVLLTIGEPQPIPLPSSTTLPVNVLQLDVLQLEFALLQQAQQQQVPGVGDRRQPFASLRQLLHHLQIPVAPHAPLGNAGNEAFYTVLAFQKLLMRDTRLPDQLFVQPQFVQPDYFAAPPVPGGGGFNPQQYSPAGGYSPYGNLPMPPPIRADGPTRNASNQSLNRTSLPLDFEPPSFPAPLSRQATGESLSGRRQTTLSHSASQDDFALMNNGGGSRQPGRNSSTLPHSQSVYWDESEYSSGGGGNRRPGQGQNGASQPSSPDTRAHRSGAPPSSLRHSQVFTSNGSGGSGSSGAIGPNSRSVSFHDGRRVATTTTRSHSSSENNSNVGSRRNSSSALGPSHLSTLTAAGTGHGSGGSGASGSGSASSGLVSESSSGKVSVENEKPKSKGKSKSGKSDKGVKHLTGALAKFWVD